MRVLFQTWPFWAVASIFLAVLFVPPFFVVLERLRGRRMQRRAAVREPDLPPR